MEEQNMPNNRRAIVRINPGNGEELYYESVTAAAKSISSGLKSTLNTISGNIANAAINRTRSVGGFKFRYATDDDIRIKRGKE